MTTADSLRVGQVPADPLTVTVSNLDDFSAYSDVVIMMLDPLGQAVALNGTVSTDGNVVTMPWGNVSVFTEPGDYTVQLRLEAPGGIVDYTTADTIEVYRPEAAP